MRGAQKQLAILERAGLAFVAVHDNESARIIAALNRILEITRDGDRLFAQGFGQVNGQPIGGPKFEVFAESEKNFFVKVTGSQITFEAGHDGRATSLTMHRAGGEPTPARRLS